MKDQLQHWNHAHAEQWLRSHSQQQTKFAEEVNERIPTNSMLLELGCGEGNDSMYFAEQGHQVIATDFSNVAIEQDKKRWSSPRLQFEVLDMSKPFKYSDNLFDAVYARLSLHYFRDNVTKSIFKEIYRVLKPGGMLCFMCKEVSDGIYGKGDEIEPDMYELDGHVRHFFSERYTKELLADFRAESVEVGKEAIYDRHSAFIKVVATKQ
jgi:ubiquinone/menaquinone biosynthesis C-methylase UbiE